jgi:acyl-homoserine-lactone acylase
LKITAKTSLRFIPKTFSLATLLLLVFNLSTFGQKNRFEPDPDIRIVRDDYGVPHIHAKTDAKLAYALAWVQCEDDFVTIQEQYLAAKGLSSRVQGKAGVITDIGIGYTGLREIAEKAYPNDYSPEFVKIIDSFTQGINTYAETHKEEVLLKKLFPLEPKDIVAGYLIALLQITAVGGDLSDLVTGQVSEVLKKQEGRGSNAFAFAPHKTTDSSTVLVINPHQPMEGWYSWYEAQLSSDEGTNITGATFIGGLSIFIGANDFLGWTHTLNYADFSDIYLLNTRGNNKLEYVYDGNWYPLEEKKLKSKLRVFKGLKIPVSRKTYESKYGPAFVHEDQVFAWQFNAMYASQAMEQWWRMNKAKSKDEFIELLKLRQIPSTNIIYADREGNIGYLSNGLIPVRDPEYDWSGILPGDTSATQWRQFLPFDSLPYLENPDCGYLFETNNTPFNCTCKEENPNEPTRNKEMGYQGKGDNNMRAHRAIELLNKSKKFSLDDIKRIKYDRSYSTPLMMRNLNLSAIHSIKAENYPDIQKELKLLQKWDHKNELVNTETILFEEFHRGISKNGGYKEDSLGSVREKYIVDAIRKAKVNMNKKYGRTDVTLGSVQMHQRGKKRLPIAGGFVSLAAIRSRYKHDQQNLHPYNGESYIAFVQFKKNGEITFESVVPYGSSNNPESPHYTDQMDLFVNQKTKKMDTKKPDFRLIQNAYAPLISAK